MKEGTGDNERILWQCSSTGDWSTQNVEASQTAKSVKKHIFFLSQVHKSTKTIQTLEKHEWNE